MTRPLSARQVRRRLEAAGFVRGREFTVDRRERRVLVRWRGVVPEEAHWALDGWGVDIQGGGMADQILVVTL